MASSLILADTSILIDYFRKTDKENSKLVQLYDQGYEFSISGITHYEIYSGATQVQIPFWKTFLNKTKIFPFDEYVSQRAVEINNTLKLQRKQIGLADLFISATALSNNLALATLNIRHFDRIEELRII